MYNENKTTVNGGIGVTGVLGVVFVVLKLLGVINWSWWLVTLPFWGGAILYILVVTLVIIWINR